MNLVALASPNLQHVYLFQCNSFSNVCQSEIQTLFVLVVSTCVLQKVSECSCPSQCLDDQ